MTSNSKEVVKYINGIPKQLNFALSQTLNKKATEATKDVEKHISANFDVTTSWYKAGNKFGARAKKSKKTNLEAFVFMARGGSISALGGGTSEHWILDHEDGSVRKAQGGGDILIPTDKLIAEIGSTKGRRGRKKVAKLTNKSKNVVFKANIKGNTYLMSRSKKLVTGSRRVRTPKGRLSKRPGKVQARAKLLFLLKKQVKLDDNLDFYKVVHKTFDTNLQKDFNTFFNKAMATAK